MCRSPRRAAGRKYRYGFSARAIAPRASRLGVASWPCMSLAHPLALGGVSLTPMQGDLFQAIHSLDRDREILQRHGCDIATDGGHRRRPIFFGAAQKRRACSGRYSCSSGSAFSGRKMSMLSAHGVIVSRRRNANCGRRGARPDGRRSWRKYRRRDAGRGRRRLAGPARAPPLASSRPALAARRGRASPG